MAAPSLTDATASRHLRLAARDPRLVFTEPLAIVELADLPYEVRLRLLHRWLALAAAGPDPARVRDEVLGAILALEGGAKLRIDLPEEAPPEHGYGAVHTDGDGQGRH